MGVILDYRLTRERSLLRSSRELKNFLYNNAIHGIEF